MHGNFHAPGMDLRYSASPAHRGQPPLSHQGSGLHFSFRVQLHRGARVTAHSAAARERFLDADQLLGAVPVAPQQANDFAAAQVGVKVHHEVHLDAAKLTSSHHLVYMYVLCSVMSDD